MFIAESSAATFTLGHCYYSLNFMIVKHSVHTELYIVPLPSFWLNVSVFARLRSYRAPAPNSNFVGVGDCPVTPDLTHDTRHMFSSPHYALCIDWTRIVKGLCVATVVRKDQ